jgi:hypothetical protein
LLVFLAALVAAPAAAAPSSTPTLSPDHLSPGDKAVVRTVFQGSKIEEFEAEIVGVLPGGRAEGTMILAKATSDRVLKSGVAMGMSGSPVYVQGKLIGALSGGWPFSREPLFEITPIGEMLEVFDHPSPKGADETAGPTGVEITGTSTGLRFKEFRWDDDDTLLETPSARSLTTFPGAPAMTPSRPSLPLACGGLNPAALEITRSWLAPYGLAVVPGGRAAPGTGSSDLVPGSAVAIEVLRGDLQFAAIGTVTYRDGDKVLLFGHPFFQSGAVRLPMASASIVTIVANNNFSFKLGVQDRPLGVVTQDRRTAVAGTLGGSPHMLPLAIRVSEAGRPDQSFRFESIEDRTLAPTLIAVASMNSLLESGGLTANQTLRWTLTLHRKGVAPLTLTDLEAGESPPSDMGNDIAAAMRFLYNNPFSRLALDSVRVAVAVEPGRDQWTLRSARLLEAAVRPGESIRVRCDLERWRGGHESRDFTLRVPEEVPDGRYTLWLGGGAELSRFESAHLPGRFRPTSLDDAWRRLPAMHASDGLFGALFARAPEMTVEGRDYPELPTSALTLMSSDQVASDRGRRGDVALLDQTRLPLSGVVRGELQLLITVDSKAP